METYIGTKEITAEKLIKDGINGYKVIYEDGYESWSPKDVFEKAYTKIVDNNKKSIKIITEAVEKVNAKEKIFLPQSYLWSLINELSTKNITFTNKD